MIHRHLSLRLLLSFLTAILILSTTFLPAAAQDNTKSFSVTPGNLLDLRLETGGDITIEGWDKNEVGVSWRLSRMDEEDVDVAFEEQNSGLVMRTEYQSRRHRGSVDFKIRVPSRFDVRFESAGGDFELMGVEGQFRGQTMGGEITLSHLKGEVDMETMGGKIWVHDAELNGSVETKGGAVRIEDVKGNLEGTTMGGEVSYRNVETSGNGRTVRVKTMGGAIHVDDAKSGANVETMGGKIMVRSANKFVVASTMGGEIIIRRIDGYVEASTMGGDIEVNMVGDPQSGDRHVELTSKGGDIELVVPDGLSMDIEIELTLIKNRWNDDGKKFRIISDFNIEEDASQEWHHHDGQEERTIYAKGQTGNGKNRVRIETINGNVYLKKAK